MNSVIERIAISAFPKQSKVLDPQSRSGLSFTVEQWLDLQLWDTIMGLLSSQQILNVTRANLPTDLTSANAGYLVYVSDYAHLLMWNGAGWQWGPGDIGSDYEMDFPIAPPNPLTGWHLCDGTQQNVLQHDGTLVARVLPGNMSRYYRL